MIVVFMHQCAMSTSVPGNGSDLGIRQAWLPLFDQYEVDLVLSGHEHDYERTYPVRGYDAGELGTVASPNPDQTQGEKVDTRRPAVVDHRAYEHNGTPAWNTAEGTVYLVLGGGGTNGPSNVYGTDTADDLPQAKVITDAERHRRLTGHRIQATAADSIEDAPWSAAINPTDAYGYSIFDVDPGERPRRDHDHLPVLRHPGGEQRSGHRPRRHDHAADGADREVRLRPQVSARRPDPQLPCHCPPVTSIRAPAGPYDRSTG